MFFIATNGLLVGYGSIINDYVRHDMIINVANITDPKQIKIFNKLLLLIYFVGTFTGCVAGGKIIQKGRRNTLLGVSVGGLIASMIFCIPNIYVWLCVRLVIGFMSGVRLVASARFIEETLP